MSHGKRRNLRKFTGFNCQLQVSAARESHFLDAILSAESEKVHRLHLPLNTVSSDSAEELDEARVAVRLVVVVINRTTSRSTGGSTACRSAP